MYKITIKEQDFKRLSQEAMEKLYETLDDLFIDFDVEEYEEEEVEVDYDEAFVRSQYYRDRI